MHHANIRMNVLITGAGGFIGQALATALAAEGKATSLILTDVVEPAAPHSAQLTIRCVQGDLTSQKLCDSLLTQDLTHVFLLHGIMSGAAEANLELGIKVNMDATRTVLDTLRTVNPAVRVIFTSTTAVYGPPPSPDFSLTEANAPCPGSSYGAQKLISETLLNDYSRRGLLDGRIVRLPTVSASLPVHAQQGTSNSTTLRFSSDQANPRALHHRSRLASFENHSMARKALYLSPRIFRFGSVRREPLSKTCYTPAIYRQRHTKVDRVSSICRA